VDESNFVKEMRKREEDCERMQKAFDGLIELTQEAINDGTIKPDEARTYFIGTIKGTFGVSFTIPSKVTGQPKEEY